MMLTYFRLFRLPNLLIIVLTQLLIRYCLILPAFKAEFFITGIFPTHLSDIDFILLVISTVLIAAAGYAINDYFDIQTDEINKPGSNVVGKKIKRNTAKNIYIIFSITGSAIGFYLALKLSKPVIGIIPLFCAASLWMYSAFYKKRFLTGNLIISMLTALSVLIVGLYEPEFYRNISYLLWYTILAFLLSLIREIIKDIEDKEGDELVQSTTIPIVCGLKKTKSIIYLLIGILLVYITYILYRNFYSNRVIDFWYLLSMFYIPFIALAYLIYTASEKKDYYYASQYSKVLMVAGLFTIFPFWYYFLR